MIKKEKNLTEQQARSIYGEDFDLEARRIKYGYYNDRPEASEESGSQRK